MTLLEIIVAFAILTAGLGAFTRVYFSNVEQTRSLARHQRALRVLENEIARTRALPSSALSPGEALPLLTEDDELAPLPEAAGFKRIAPYQAAPGLYELTVSLTWTGPNNRRIEQSLTTLLPAAEVAP